MARVFGEIAQIVTKYEGFIEKFIGDAVVALFKYQRPTRTIQSGRFGRQGKCMRSPTT